MAAREPEPARAADGGGGADRGGGVLRPLPRDSERWGAHARGSRGWGRHRGLPSDLEVRAARDAHGPVGVPCGSRDRDHHHVAVEGEENRRGGGRRLALQAPREGHHQVPDSDPHWDYDLYYLLSSDGGGHGRDVRRAEARHHCHHLAHGCDTRCRGDHSEGSRGIASGEGGAGDGPGDQRPRDPSLPDRLSHADDVKGGAELDGCQGVERQ
mmetsp:Transcript_7530/g.16616  ORF Transcript_7530/g.16616 Transcript_7530/m.16616 type:complete len:212 (-) Transcript_7530:1171-1806(-)